MSMNDADRRLSAWLESVAPAREPEHLLDDVLAQTARTRRRTAWRIPERWIPMTSITTPVTAGGSARWPVAVATALLVLALVAGAILVAGSRRPPVPAPFGPASNGLIVHEISDRLASVDPVTGKSTTIGDAGTIAIGPQFSRDGTVLAFVTAADTSENEPEELRVAGIDGSEPRSLGMFTPPGTYAWSPTGDLIAVGSMVDDVRAISIVDVERGTSSVLDLGIEAEEPAFRPSDPAQIAFTGHDGGTPGLYLARIDGGAPTLLDLDPGFKLDANYGINRYYYFLAPAWSPDGTRLAYYTLEESTIDPDPGWRVHVAEVAADGTVTAEMTLAPDPAIDDEFEPVWLPDGSGLVVHRIEEGRHALVRWQLGGQLDPTPTSETLLDDQPELRFVVAPDGTEVMAWDPGSIAQRIPLDGGQATSTGTVLGEIATWQRTAP